MRMRVTVVMIMLMMVIVMCARSDAFDVMVMAFLRQPNLGLKAQNLRPIFTHGTIHIVASVQNFRHPIGKGGNHLWVVI